MISFEHGLWFSIGIMAGLTHATMLWQSVHRLTAWTPLIGLLRIGIVASVMVASALSRNILPSAAGWLAGFVVLAVWYFVAYESRKRFPPKVNSHD